MNRRDFLKLLGMAAVVVAAPVSIKAVVENPEPFRGIVDEWMRIFTEELKPFELREFEIVSPVISFGETVKGLVTDGREFRYFMFMVDMPDRANIQGEEFIRLLAADVREELRRGFKS